MNYDITEDQAVLRTSIEQLVGRHKALPAGAGAFVLPGDALERDLEEGGYFDIAREEGMGAFEASMIVEAVAMAPCAVEIAATALVAAKIVPDRKLPRPIVLAQAPASGAIRFLGRKGTALIDNGEDVRMVDLSKCEVEALETPFAYPLGAFVRPEFSSAPVVSGCSPETLRQWWRVAIAAEITGLAQATLDVTVEYVKQRKQFNRAIGSFQAIQHRLSECAGLVESMRSLMRYAAWSGKPEDASMACAFAQEAAAKIHYDCHQFHGAMGITVDCNLHYWTYRLKFIQSELGGHSGTAQDAATQIWGAA